MRFSKLLPLQTIPHPGNTIPSRVVSSRSTDAGRPIADGGSDEFYGGAVQAVDPEVGAATVLGSLGAAPQRFHPRPMLNSGTALTRSPFRNLTTAFR